jgi:hypothetical protein
MNTTSTVKIGNEFRNRIEKLLIAANFSTVLEKRIAGMTVDIIAKKRGHTKINTYGIEAKNYKKNITKHECQQFITDYKPLVETGQLDESWLVSATDISPDAMALIDNVPHLSFLTYNQLQRNLFGIVTLPPKSGPLHERGFWLI